MRLNTALIVAGTILLNIAASLCQLDECGQAPLNNKIFGGEAATAGAWPWQVSIHITCDGDLCYCGGSLINKDWVLSAAHCLQGFGTSDIMMYFGRLRRSGLNPYETNRTASRIIIHHTFNNPKNDNDIGLIQLSSSVTFTDYIRPVCLAAAGSTFAAGTEIWVTGWGKLHSGGECRFVPFPDILQEVQVPIVSNSDCYNAYGGLITNNMICAGLIKVGGKGSCQGDSGGPVVSWNGSLWIQSGIVSFAGVKCDDPRYPSVFTRVSQYQDWIATNIANNTPRFVEFNNNGFRSSLNLFLFSISLTFSIIPFTFSHYLSS
ncbi:trypsin I-P1-like [Cyprinus carpio]|uniref:Trypsin I-P1-like n=1 Tax=Cyprinus carpio TaxID=7962 RepID=A0A9Q9W6S3_CYPCA|nr:trypsin I-P1-like [Cyprinus carpio]